MLFVALLVVVVVVVVVVLLLLNTTVYPLVGLKLTVLVVFEEVEDEPPLVGAVLVVVEVVV